MHRIKKILTGFFRADHVDHRGSGNGLKNKGNGSPEYSVDGQGEAKQHFEEILTAARWANDELAQKNRPFIFHVYRDGDSVYIDIITRKPDGTDQTVKKNITHYEFHHLIKNLENLEGMLLDVEK